jgi:hypothetical protein
MRQFTILFCLSFLSLFTCGQTISARQAMDFIGKEVKVCDIVVQVKFASTVNRQPTFMDFGAKYPNELFTALVWGDDLGKFTYSLKNLQGKNICVSGVITLYKGRPEIIVHSPNQIETN